jgi:hypothetical protein
LEDREYIELKDRVADGLFAIPGVHGVGVGDKIVGGERTSDTSIRVYVTQKRPLEEIPPEERVPTEIEGVKTDVVEEPPITELQVAGIPLGTERADPHEYRPLRGGSQLARGGSSDLGTLGCLCDVTGDPSKVIALTNYHVIYDPPATDDNEEVGQPAGQSSSSESCDDIFGRVLDAEYDQDVDIVLIRLNPNTRYLAEIEGVGVVPGIGPAPALNDQVTKRGRSSGLTGGFVDDPSSDGDVFRPDGTLKRHYRRAIRILPNPDPANPAGPTAFSIPGDSGSALLNAANQVIGIVFAGAPGVARAIPMDTIVKKFTGVPIAPGEPTLPASRHVALAVASAGAPGDIRTVPAAMTADQQPVREPMTPGQARQLEEQVRSASPRGAWYADLYRRHGDEVATLVHGHRRVTVVWHRSGAAELAQCIVRAFSRHDERVPEEIQGRPVRACLDDIAAALTRYGSAALSADLTSAVATLPDIAGLSDGEILDRLKLETVA